MRRLFGAVCLVGCQSSTVPSPFSGPHNPDAGADAVALADVGPDADQSLGGPCLDDSQCDDDIECTFEHCDLSIKRCRYEPDHSKCADSTYCDGLELCEPGVGCREGEPISCSDDNTCTIDTCVESTQACDHTPRDVDQDGDPDWACGGGDCNDVDPNVSSLGVEVCANGKDDDCDKKVDEAGCQAPAHDACVDALDIQKSGVYSLSLAAAASDYSASCAPAGPSVRDVVAALIVPPGAPVDIDVVALTPSGSIALASAAQCGDPSSEIACHASTASAKGGQIARLRLRGLGEGAYPLYLFGDGGYDVTLKVDYLAPTQKPVNETCGTAVPISPGTSESVWVLDAAEDLVSQCQPTSGELVYSIALSEPRDVHAYAVSVDGYGTPMLGIWQSPCGTGDELVCHKAAQAHAFRRALGPGTIYLSVSSTAPSLLSVLVQLAPPTTPPADETCAGAPSIPLNADKNVELSGHTDDVGLGCLAGAVDAAYTLDLQQKSDLMLVGRVSGGDTAALILSEPACSSAMMCSSSSVSPVRVARHALDPGSYRAVVESIHSAPVILTPLSRPAQAPTLVAFADTCSNAISIPATGGFYQGNTSNAAADYDAGCDFGGAGPGGAPDQMLKLTLTATRRVVFDMKGSAYSTLLNVRKGPLCPGSELLNACAAGYVANKSFLDLTLEPGQYWVQVDGYSGDAGQWMLDVFVVDP